MELFNDTVRYVMNTDIPSKILEDAFMTNKHDPSRNRSIGDCLIERIILNKVMPDLNGIGGTLIDIPLYECPFEYDDTVEYRYHRIYRIDPKYTQNRPIHAVLRAYNNGVISAVGGTVAQGIGVTAYQSSDLDTMVRKQVNTLGRPIKFSDSDIELVGDYVLRVTNTIMLTYNLTLECRIKYSEQFHELNKPYHIEFFKLVNLATKAYIYRELRLQIDMYKLDGGRELGVYKEYIDNYADANDQYQEQLDTRWGKLLVLGDTRRNNKARWATGFNV